MTSGQQGGAVPAGDTDAIERLETALASMTKQMWEQSKRADEADHRLVAAENGQVMMIDVQEHRNEAYQSGWNDGYAEGAAKAIADARLAAKPAPAGGLRPHD